MGNGDLVPPPVQECQWSIGSRMKRPKRDRWVKSSLLVTNQDTQETSFSQQYSLVSFLVSQYMLSGYPTSDCGKGMCDIPTQFDKRHQPLESVHFFVFNV